MAVGDVIASFASTLTVTRRAVATYGADGRVDAGATSTFTIAAVVQPLSGDALARLPEGRTADEVRALWTQTELRIPQEGVGGDLVSAEGATWEVQSVETWSVLGDYFRILMAKV